MVSIAHTVFVPRRSRTEEMNYPPRQDKILSFRPLSFFFLIIFKVGLRSLFYYQVGKQQNGYTFLFCFYN